MVNFWSVNCWSAKYTVHPNFFLGTFYFLNLLGKRFQNNLEWEDPERGVRVGPSCSWTIQALWQWRYIDFRFSRDFSRPHDQRVK